MIRVGKYKLKHTMTNGLAKVGSAKDYTEARAIAYAEWLAARDGVLIPEKSKGYPVWSGVHIEGAFKQRVRAVEFREERSYWHRKHDGLGPVLATISIPHWDWVPQMTEETLELDLAAY